MNTLSSPGIRSRSRRALSAAAVAGVAGLGLSAANWLGVAFVGAGVLLLTLRA